MRVENKQTIKQLDVIECQVEVDIQRAKKSLNLLESPVKPVSRLKSEMFFELSKSRKNNNTPEIASKLEFEVNKKWRQCSLLRLEISGRVSAV